MALPGYSNVSHTNGRHEMTKYKVTGREHVLVSSVEVEQ